MRPFVALRCLIAALLLATLAPTRPLAHAAVPTGFTEAELFPFTESGPTAMAFLPDGRILITQKNGKLRVVKDGALLPNPALDLGPVLCTESERGLLGVAVHPQFATNGYIYLYYTHKKDPPATDPCSKVTAGDSAFAASAFNRVSRFKLTGNVVDTSVPEQAIIHRAPSYRGNHNAGDLHFGNDGYLYVSIGDGGGDYRDGGEAGNNDAAREEHTLLGKIVRVTDTGEIPPDNPFTGANSGRCALTGRTDPGKRCQETFAWGLRNPFRIAFDPNAASTRFYINDVGQNSWEEIDEAVAGADYGWNNREGFCAYGSGSCRNTPGAVVNGQTDPIHAYGRSVGYSITGGAFVPAGVWPTQYDDDYLFADYNGKIFWLEREGQNYTRSDFANSGGNLTALAFGPTATGTGLYYLKYNNVGGALGLISYSGDANRSPNAVASANVNEGSVPLTVSFDGSASSDPDAGNTLSYRWDFGDGTPIDTTSGATAQHTYTVKGVYTARLVVRDNNGAEDSTPATIQISAGNGRPVPSINAPTAGFRYAAGQQITLQGSALDSEDGPLPGTRLTWTVLLHHASHTHPILEATTGLSVTFTAPPPEDLAATENSYIEARLSAIDSQGATSNAPVTLSLMPRTVAVTFTTEPANLRLLVNDLVLTRTTTLISWQNYALSVQAPAQPDGKGGWLRLVRWSNDGAANQTITTPAQPTTYKATFEPGYVLLLPVVRK